tara:strand:- start:229 stop:735 length:507 start_codon:yes stop_codon:yes gene_type:complete
MKTQQAVAKFVKPLNNTLSNKITALNAGGCGHFAYEVGKQLKRLGIPFKIWVLETWNDDYEKKRTKLTALRNNQQPKELGSLSFAHCYIEVDGFCFDGHQHGKDFVEYWFASRGAIKTGEYSLQDMYFALKYGTWNECFKVDTELPKLKNTITKKIEAWQSQYSKNLV